MPRRRRVWTPWSSACPARSPRKVSALTQLRRASLIPTFSRLDASTAFCQCCRWAGRGRPTKLPKRYCSCCLTQPLTSMARTCGFQGLAKRCCPFIAINPRPMIGPSLISVISCGARDGRATDVPVAARHILKDKPNVVLRKLQHVADCIDNTRRDLVLLLLRTAFDEANVYERHGSSGFIEPSLAPIGRPGTRSLKACSSLSKTLHAAEYLLFGPKQT